jgi:uncharacterized protein (DUF2141 family)
MTRVSVGAVRLALAMTAIIGSDAPALAQSAAGSPARAVLSVRFEGLRSPRGAVMVALFDNEAAYAKGAAPLRVAKISAVGADIRVTFADLKPGAFAIKAFHDLNGDGKLDMGLFGIPTEPVAFSNDARATTRPPSWAQAAFTALAGASTQTINLR